MDTNRKIYLDIAKGIAIILVVIGHILGEGGVTFSHSNFLRSCIYSFHMPVFFMISGMSIYYSLNRQPEENKLIHLKRNCKRILVLYFVWSFIYFLLTGISEIDLIIDEFMCVFSFRGRAPIWYLGSLFLCQIVIIFLFKFSKYMKLNFDFCLIVSSILCIIFTYLGVYFRENILYQYHLECYFLNYLFITFVRLWPTLFFLLYGYLSVKIFDNLKKFTDVYLSVFIAIFFICLFFLFRNSINIHLAEFGNISIFYFEAILGSTALILWCKLIERIRKNILKIMTYLGKSTMAIMVFHYYPFPIMQSYIKIFRGWCNGNELVVLFFSTIFIIGTCCMIQEILKKVKIV